MGVNNNIAKFQEELIEGIQEVAMNTGLTTKEYIRQAIELTKRTEKQYKDTYLQQQYKSMFKRWR